VFAGTPSSVADQILAFRNDVGAFGTLLYTGHDWADAALARRSMELTANEVWPRIVSAARQADRRLPSTMPARYWSLVFYAASTQTVLKPAYSGRQLRSKRVLATLPRYS
jgi:hypothetical protein